MSPPSDPGTTLRQQIEAAFAQQDWPDLIRKADYLIKFLPTAATSSVHRWRGLALLAEGEVQQAQEALETALVLVSSRGLRLTLLSDYTALLARQDQWAKVLQRTKEALRLVPNDPSWLATQQQAHSQLSKQASIPPQTKEQGRPKEQPLAQPSQKTKEQWLDESNALDPSQSFRTTQARQRTQMEAQEHARCTMVIERITDRELDVLRAFAKGLTQQEVVKELGITTKTVDRHKTRLLDICREVWAIDPNTRIGYHFLYKTFAPFFDSTEYTSIG